MKIIQSFTKILTTTILVHLICISLHAQSNAGGLPIALPSKQLKMSSDSKQSDDIPTISMPAISNENVLQEIETQRKLKKNCGNKFAHQFKTNINLKEQGKLTSYKNENGETFNVWQLKIKSKNALSLNLIFNNLQLSVQSKLFIFDPDQNQILGAYTKENNTPFSFAISPIAGETLVLQLEEPESANSESPIITKVNHGVKTLPEYNVSEECEVNAAHDEIHLNQRRSACLLLIDGETYCSGNLVANTRQDGMPYIISASHCFWLTDKQGKDYIDTTLAHTTVTFFNYETPVEDWKIKGSMEMSVSGGFIMAYNIRKDMLLFRLKELPAPDFRPYMSGWNATETVTSPVYVFHHPNGDLKKVSTDEDDVHTASFDNGITFDKNSHWQVGLWDEGLTESGSSGSGLFDANGLIVGNLSGGNTLEDCDTRGEDLFWKLSDSWHKGSSAKADLSPWLDPGNTGVSTCEGHELYNNPCIRVTNRKDGDELSNNTKENGIPLTSIVSTDGTIEIAEKFTQSTQSSLYGIYFIPFQAKYSSKTPYEVCICKETTDADGNKTPGEIIHRQTLKITATEYESDMFGNKFVNTTINQLNSKENYLRLDSVVKVDSVFYVVFRIGNEKQNTSAYISNPFVIAHSSARNNKTDNTAYFKDNGQWNPFTEHPEGIGPISLMTDVVLRKGWDIKDSINPVLPQTNDSSYTPIHSGEETGFSLYPSIVKDGIIHFTIPENEKLCSFVVSDISGHQIYKEDYLSISSNYTAKLFKNELLEDGIYIVRANYRYQSKSFKIIVKKND